MFSLIGFVSISQHPRYPVTTLAVSLQLFWGASAVDKLAEFLDEYSKHNILIGGFTDNADSAEYN